MKALILSFSLLPRFLQLAIPVLVVTCAFSSRAATVVVCDEAGLRAALPGGGTIQFACDGIIALSNTLVIATNTVLDGNGRNVVLSGRQAIRVLQVNSGVTFTARGLAIVNGMATNGAGLWSQGGTVQLLECTFSNNWANGEGLSSTNASLTISGGALFNDGGSVIASDTLFLANLARAASNSGPAQTAMGGAIWSRGSLTVIRSRLVGNAALGTNGANLWGNSRAGGSAFGGAIFNDGFFTLLDSFFLGNRAVAGLGGLGNTGFAWSPWYPGGNGGAGGHAFGGGIYLSNGILSIKRSTLAENTARAGDGGFGGKGGDGNNPYRQGTAGGNGGAGGEASGGAIHVETMIEGEFQNNTLVANGVLGGNGSAGGGGGYTLRSLSGFDDPGANGGNAGAGGTATGSGIRFNYGTNAAVVQCTVAYGTATGGSGASGGAGGVPRGFPGTAAVAGLSLGHGVHASRWVAILENCILAYNQPGGDCGGFIVDAGNNLFSGPSCATLAQGSWANANPMLLPLADNGGPAPTVALAIGSPAVDGAKGTGCLGTDERGLARPVGLGCDIGAFESSFTTNEEPKAVLQFSQASYSMSEASTWLVVPVIRTGGRARSVRVLYETVAGTAQPLRDFVPVNGVLDFPAVFGVATQYISVRLLADVETEAPETLRLSLSSPSAGADLGVNSNAVVTLTEVEASFVQFDAPTFWATETDGSAFISVTRSGNLDTTVTVDCSTRDGTALNGQDYLGRTNTLTFGPGVGEIIFVFPLIDDTRAEPTKSVQLLLGNPLGGAALGSPAFATLFVNSDDLVTSVCSLEELATGIQDGGRILFNCDTVMNVTRTLVVNTNVELDANGHSVVLSGGDTVRHFWILPGSTLSLRGLVVAQGGGYNAAAPSTSHSVGGAILIGSGGRLAATSCLFSNNHAQGLTAPYSPFPGAAYHGYGGAIGSSGGVILLTNVVFYGNRAKGGKGGIPPNSGGGNIPVTGQGGTGYGGAIFLEGGTLVAVGVNAINNRAEPGDPGDRACFCNPGPVGNSEGGAVSATAAIIQWRGGVLAGNLCGGSSHYVWPQGAATGGALSLNNGTLVASELLVASNQVVGAQALEFSSAQAAYGGGFYLGDNSDTRITNSAFVRNVAFSGQAFEARGGAIANAGKLNLANVTLANNVARGGSSHLTWVAAGSARGGGLFSATTNLVLLQHTSWGGNWAERGFNGVPDTAVAEGGGLYASNTVILRSSLIANSPLGSNCWGAVIDGGYNLSSDNSCPFNLGSSRNSIDPRLAPLANNGGPTPTLALLPGSPAIDAADPASCLPTDQRGRPRPMLIRCDIGAFEFTPEQFAITSITLPAGQVRLDGQGPPSQPFRVQTSSDLRVWADATTGTVQANGVFSVQQIGGGSVRFYRLAAP